MLNTFKLNTFKMVTYSLLGFSVALTGCGSGGGSGGAGAPPPVVTPGPGILPASSQIGFYAQSSNFYMPGYINAGSTFQAQQGMHSLLKEAMGTCDREQTSGGLASCQTWISGAHDMVLWADGGSTVNQVTIVIRSAPANQMGGAGWYSYSLPDFESAIIGLFTGWFPGNTSGIFNPLVLKATIWPVNNSQGFEARAYGPQMSYAWNKLLQLQVSQGKLEDPSWSYQLVFNGAVAANGTAVRCQSQYCGMDRSYFNTAY